MKKYLTACFLLIIIFLASASTPDLITPYLPGNYSSLDIENLNLNLMAGDLDKHDVFLSGAEWHGSTAGYELQYAMTTALHQQAGIKYLLLGMGHATAQMINAYLQSGDETILDTVLEEIKFSNSSCYEHRLSWERLCQYNLTQPQEDRITVVGIDLEYQPYTAIAYLLGLPDADKLQLPLPDEYLGTPQALANYVSRLEQNVLNNTDAYRQALGEGYGELELVLNNLKDTVQANIAEDFYAVREEIMYANFLRAYSSLPPGKYFGQLTMEHIYQRQAGTPNMSGIDRLAMYLNRDDSPVQDRILSIAVLYENSRYRFFYGRYYEDEISNDYITDVLPFKLLAKTNYTLFRLNGEDSPFASRPYTVVGSTGGATTDYYQYLLIIRNSRPGSPNKK